MTEGKNKQRPEERSPLGPGVGGGQGARPASLPPPAPLDALHVIYMIPIGEEAETPREATAGADGGLEERKGRGASEGV